VHKARKHNQCKDLFLSSNLRAKRVLSFQTIGAAFGAKQMVSNSTVVILGIWDTAGSERYQAMSRMYYREAKAAIVCYGMACPASSFCARGVWVTVEF